MANKRKTTTTIVAGVTAVALLLGGTFAWTSISQQAKNESAGIVNVGGRLHDDFNGENKDVYVENFTDPLNGGQPIYARVKLTEYMEVGKEAGKLDENGDYAADRNAESVVENATINDLDSWSIHVPADSCAKCSTGDTCQIHDHWEWTMGGQTTYMPTFNKDKDSLDADINGTYAGTNLNDKIYYDDYVTYVTENGIAVDMNDADFEAPAGATNATPLTEATGAVTSVTGNEYYDDDTDTYENDHATGAGVRIEENVTHTAKETATATVMTMQAWKDAGSLPGNYWVYDTDGWAYWANPIMPGEATGLLLSNIEMTSNPGEKCYYAINVVGQFATVNDWEYFDEDNDSQFDGTDDALTLLATAADNVTTVTVVNNGATTLSTVADEEAGTTNTTSFTATATKAGDSTATAAEGEFTWAVYDAELNPVETSAITTDGVLTVGENEKNKNLIIAAKHTESGAVGLASVAIDVQAEPVYSISVLSKTYDDGEGGTYDSPYPGYLADGESWTMQLDLDGVPVTDNVTWSMELIYSDSTSDTELSEGTAIDSATGELTVAEGETSDSYTYHIIKVTASIDGVEMTSENLAISSEGITNSGLVIYEAGTTNRVSSGYLTKGGTYDVRIGYFHQTAYNNNATDYLDPISFEDTAVTITDGDGNSTDKATFVDGKFTATEVGSYKISVTAMDNYGYENTYNGYVTVQEGLSIIFAGTLYSSGGTATYGVMSDGTISEGLTASESDNITWEVVSVTGNVNAYFREAAPNWLIASGCSDGDQIVIKVSKSNGLFGTLTIIVEK